MREDMAKVIVERPRRQSRTRSGRARAALARVLDDGAVPLGGRRAAALVGDRKSLNENLAPLKRYLLRQLGRPWRKVNAEIAARLRADSTVQQHVLGHVRDCVIAEVGIGRDGEWLGRGGWRAIGGVADWITPLYVDPVDGLIKETAKLQRKLGLPVRAGRGALKPLVRIPDPDRVVVSADEELHRIDGIWFSLRLGAVVDEAVVPPHGRAWCWRRTTIVPGRERDGERGDWRALLGKRQLSGRELAAQDLANRPDFAGDR